jgi:hypothetical protein
VTIIVILLIGDITQEEADVLSDIIVWSATLAGVIVSGYMGNSSIEKYAQRKFSILNTASSAQDEETLSNG